MAYDPDEHIIGHGKKIEYSDVEAMTSPTRIHGTVEINLPESELEATEHTNDDSPDFHKEYMPSLIEPGTIGFTYKYAKTEFAKLETLKQLAASAATRGSVTKWWRVTLADGSTSKGRGFLTKNTGSGEQEDAIECEAEIQCTGPWVFTPAAE